MNTTHWSNHLVRGFPMDDTAEVTIPINARETHAGMVLVASRITGLMDALGPIDPENPSTDQLSEEDTSEIGRLLDHLHRVRMVLEGQEERLIRLLAERGVPLRTIALSLECSPQTVANRLDRIERAAEHGLSAAGLDERENRS